MTPPGQAFNAYDEGFGGSGFNNNSAWSAPFYTPQFVPTPGNPGANIAGAQSVDPSAGYWNHMHYNSSAFGLGHGQHEFYNHFANMIGTEYTKM